MKILLDTHALIWFAFGSPRISAAARDAIEALDNEVYVSAATAWELSTKVRIGKLPIASRFAAEFRKKIKSLDFHELPVTVEHGQRAGLLPGAHKDPFDRMLIAQALTEDMPIVSNEQIFDSYLVRRIW